MPSTNTRGQIVQDALSLAGRSTELKQSCNQWLNYWLLNIGLTFRFPELRKIGAQSTLAMGSDTAPLPADLGVGMDKQGLLFGPEMRALDEYSYEDFAYNGGFYNGTPNGRPFFYMVDRQAGVFRFNYRAQQAYPFVPVYFIQPPLLPVATGSDNQSIWLDNDIIAVQGLIQMIYQFMEDPREMAQEQKVTAMLQKWQRETTKMGGQSRVLPSPRFFKHINFGGYGYGP